MLEYVEVEADDGNRVDVVLEMAGGRVFDASLRALAPFGRLVTYGMASREPNRVAAGRLKVVEAPSTRCQEPAAPTTTCRPAARPAS